MGWGHLEPIVDVRNTYAYAVKRKREKPLRGPLEDNSKMDLKTRRLVVCAAVILLRIVASCELCEHGNEH